MSADLARLAHGVLHVPAAAAAPVRFAADELDRYLRRLFGAAPERLEVPGPPTHWLSLAASRTAPSMAATAVPADAEHVVRTAGDDVVLAGGTPRALLTAAYDLLAGAGCRWAPEGAPHETVPAPGTAARAVTERVVRPRFARRAFAADLATWHPSMPERLRERLPADLAFVDWMAKTGATGFLFIRHANDDAWTIPALRSALAARGLAVEPGGHALVELLPRARFAAHPDWFPAGEAGRRTDCGNACVASAGALATIAARARAALAALPEARAFHLWGLDLWGGGWCHCPACAPLAPSDQALTVCNAAAAALGGARVFHLAYHDTLAPPTRVRPHPGVWAEFAPRERCYAHALGDPACAENAPYRDALLRHLDHFAGRVDVFEYYGDAILFGGCAVPLAEVVARDLDWYASVGVRGVSCLVFGTWSLLAHGVNVEAFAGAACGSIAPPAARAAHAARVAGPAAAAFARYLTALERLLAPALAGGDLLLPPRDEPRAAAAEAALARLVGDAPGVRRLLADAAGPGAAARLAAEAPLFDYTVDVLAAMHAWLAAVRAGTPADVAAARTTAALEVAAAHLDAVPASLRGTWGVYDLRLTLGFYAPALASPTDPRRP